MNREIKFRGLTVDSKEWFYGFIYRHDPPLQCFESNEQRADFAILKTGFADWNMVRPIDQHEVIGDSVGQFTGLTDKNGVDIYEDDIGEIKTQSGRVERFVVKWGIHRRDMKSGWTVDIPGFCFEIDKFPTFPIVNNYLNGHDLEIIEIIGNIHQHPSLLTQ